MAVEREFSSNSSERDKKKVSGLHQSASQLRRANNLTLTNDNSDAMEVLQTRLFINGEC